MAHANEESAAHNARPAPLTPALQQTGWPAKLAQPSKSLPLAVSAATAQLANIQLIRELAELELLYVAIDREEFRLVNVLLAHGIPKLAQVAQVVSHAPLDKLSQEMGTAQPAQLAKPPRTEELANSFHVLEVRSDS